MKEENETNVQSKTNRTEKMLSILMGVIWFIIISIAWYFSSASGLLFNTIIADTSKVLGYSIYYIIPAIIIFLPIIMRSVLKKTILKSIIIAVCSVIIYIIIFFVLSFGLKRYFSSFSEYKWENYVKNRSLMIEDLNNKYKIVGMEKEKIINLLGRPAYTKKNEDTEEEEFHYYIKQNEDFWFWYLVGNSCGNTLFL